MDIAHKWNGFGTALQLAPALLDKIEKESGNDVDSCLKKVVSLFLKQNYKFSKYGYPTWRKIIQAVYHRVGGCNPALALEIARKHRKGSNYKIYYLLFFHIVNINPTI